MQNSNLSYEELRLFSLVFKESLAGIMITDAENKIIKVNSAFSSMTGYAQEEIIGLEANILKSDVNNSIFYYKMWNSLIKKGEWRGEIWNRKKDDTAITCLLSIKALYNESGNIQNYIAMYLDITEKKQSEDEVFHLAYHDTLTKLPNRTQFNKHITELIEIYDRKNSTKEKYFAVLFLDLDNFKYVNDTFGHNIGDLLLIKVAKIFKSILRKIDFVARLGGDEFTIVVEEYENIQQIKVLCTRIINRLSEQFEIKGHKFNIGCSIGIAIYPKDGSNKNLLIQHADTAMYQSKRDGKNKFTFHTQQMNDELNRKMQLDIGLKEALQFGEFEMHYQAKVSIENENVLGAEALIRWKNPLLGYVSPEEFIPYAEESGFILEIGKFILQEVFTKVSSLETLHNNLIISVNISSLQLEQEDFLDIVKNLLEETRCNPHMIEFEITETKIMTNIEENIEKLLELKALGISISIDDFGTGYSSMSYLQKLPIDIIKIDKSFIDEMLDSEDSKILTRAIISLSQALNLKTIAEGVESNEQKEYLKKLGCDYIQGYLYAKPLPFRLFLSNL